MKTNDYISYKLCSNHVIEIEKESVQMDNRTSGSHVSAVDEITTSVRMLLRAGETRFLWNFPIYIPGVIED